MKIRSFFVSSLFSKKRTPFLFFGPLFRISLYSFFSALTKEDDDDDENAAFG